MNLQKSQEAEQQALIKELEEKTKLLTKEQLQYLTHFALQLKEKRTLSDEKYEGNSAVSSTKYRLEMQSTPKEN